MIQRPRARRPDTNVAAVADQVRALRQAVTVAERSAEGVRFAPDPVALYYDLARLDSALQHIRDATAALQTLVRFSN